MYRISIALLLGLALASPALSQSLFISTDVPALLGTDDYLPRQIARIHSGSYFLARTLPDGTDIDALHRENNGGWLFSVEVPTNLGGTEYDPRDIIRLTGAATYSKFFDGVAAGIPEGVNVDAFNIPFGGATQLVVSFDVPTEIGGTVYEPADLAEVSSGSFSMFFDASAAGTGIPNSVNTTGADSRSGRTILTFDVPVTLGGTDYIPGDVVAWDGSNYSLHYRDAAWPPGARIDALARLGAPGWVKAKLRVRKSTISPLTKLILSWSDSCLPDADDYAIYAGVLGSWYSHEAIDCHDDGGDLEEEVTPVDLNQSYYYLVVATNDGREGSYGTDSNLVERPAGLSTCEPEQEIVPCP